MLATITPGPASSGVPSGTNAARTVTSGPAAGLIAGVAGGLLIVGPWSTAPGPTWLVWPWTWQAQR